MDDAAAVCSIWRTLQTSLVYFMYKYVRKYGFYIERWATAADNVDVRWLFNGFDVRGEHEYIKYVMAALNRTVRSNTIR